MRFFEVNDLCEFSQDPERIPCGLSNGRCPDRVFCVSLAICHIRESANCVCFPRTPKGSRAHFQKAGILTVCFVGMWQLTQNGAIILWEFSQDPERLPWALAQFHCVLWERMHLYLYFTECFRLFLLCEA